MNLNKLKFIHWLGVLFVSASLVAGCNSFVDGYDISPNSPLEVSNDLLLPSAQLSIGSMLGEDMAWYSQVFLNTQYGSARQMNSAARYDVIAGDVNNAWNSTYAGHLFDLNIVIDSATAQGSPHYSGVAKVMTALTLGSLADSWGDIPYEEALQGLDNLFPGYDDAQSEIYPTIDRLLDEAIEEMAAATSLFSPGADDLVYGGDLDLWTKTAYALKARYANHASNTDADGSANSAIAALANAYTSNADNALIPYLGSSGSENPWFQFNQQRGDLVMGKFFIGLLNDNNDPRLSFFAAANDSGEFVGASVADPNPEASFMGPFYGSANSSLPLITYYEMKFIEAEAQLRLGNNDDALDAFEAAIRASVMDVTGAAADSAFVADILPDNAADLTLANIMEQKYVAMFTQLESWVDVRRTGEPNVPVAAGFPSIPTSYPYPQRERELNPNTPEEDAVTQGLFDKIWWDN